MAITEENRHRLYQRLEELLGSAEAATLMEHLPPVGWADVATKRDLDHLAQTAALDFQRHGAELRAEFRAGLLRVTLAVVAANAAMTAAVVAGVRLG